jgi:transposase
MRYELADDEWIAIKPMLPNKPRGVPRVNDRRVLNGIFWVCIAVRGAVAGPAGQIWSIYDLL